MRRSTASGQRFHPHVLRIAALLVAATVFLLVLTAAQSPTLAGAQAVGQANAPASITTATEPTTASPALLSSAATLDLQRARVWGVSLCVIGCLLTMGLYHLALSAMRKQGTYLYFALVCFFWAGFFVTGDFTQWVVAAFIQTPDSLLLYKIHMSFFLASRPCGYRFLRALYPQEFSRNWQHVCDALPLVFGPMLWVAPYFYATRGLVLLHAVTACIVLYVFWRLVVCARLNRDGARFILSGFGVAGVLGIYRMLRHDGVLEPLLSVPSAGALVMLGVLLYVLSQALALVQQYAKAFEQTSNLSATLQESNLALRREADARNRLERKIISISEEERRRLSRELHDGLCQHLTGARLHCAILENHVPEGPAAEQLSQLSGLLDASVNEAYGMSRGLWPVEHGADTPGLSLETLVRHLAKTSDVKMDFRQELRCAACTNPNAVPICRIAQEAVINAIKHSRADRIQVSLVCRKADGLRLQVSDNGIGRGKATTSHGGLGLEIMAHRARVMLAEFEIADAPEGGTVVRCVAPCSEPSPGAADGVQEES